MKKWKKKCLVKICSTAHSLEEREKEGRFHLGLTIETSTV
jgi:hypothetical protein